MEFYRVSFFNCLVPYSKGDIYNCWTVAILSSFLPWYCYAENTKIMNVEQEFFPSRLFTNELSKKKIAEICLNEFFLKFNCCCCCCSTEDSTEDLMQPEPGHTSVGHVGWYTVLVGCVLAQLAVGPGALRPASSSLSGPSPQVLTLLGGDRFIA